MLPTPNVFLVGPGRTATTSLFRILLQHPDICGSKKKEAGRYREIIFSKTLKPFSDYQKLFTHCQNENNIIDATPGYFFGGNNVAEKIKQESPNSKIIIVLRDPIERAFSLYNHVRNKQGYSLDETFEEFLIKCKSQTFSSKYDEDSIRYSCLLESLYGRLIGEWENIFGSSNILLLNFDQIKDKSPVVLEQINHFLELPNNVKLNYIHENKSITPKFKKLHAFTLWINDRLEFFLNKHYKLKSNIRNIYYSLNTKAEESLDINYYHNLIIDYYKVDYHALDNICGRRGINLNWLKKYT